MGKSWGRKKLEELGEESRPPYATIGGSRTRYHERSVFQGRDAASLWNLSHLVCR